MVIAAFRGQHTHMKTGLIVLIVGLVVAILGWTGSFSSEGFTNGSLTLVVGYPLIIIGMIVSIISFVKNKNK
jgi:protein-S-isoprenylcysteine O-methyltransferase Ste14